MEDPLPSHIRPEDEVYFRPPFPLRPMTFVARWILGALVLCAAQLVLLPILFAFEAMEKFGDRIPAWAVLGLLLLVAILGPLWASMLARSWLGSRRVHRYFARMIDIPTKTP